MVDLERHGGARDDGLRRADDVGAAGDAKGRGLADVVGEALHGDEVAVREHQDVVRCSRDGGGSDERPAGDHDERQHGQQAAAARTYAP
jgi:hypothetical protein